MGVSGKVTFDLSFDLYVDDFAGSAASAGFARFAALSFDSGYVAYWSTSNDASVTVDGVGVSAPPDLEALTVHIDNVALVTGP
jgi:hypothetical protein